MEKTNYTRLRRIPARIQGAASSAYSTYSPLAATLKTGRKASKVV